MYGGDDAYSDNPGGGAYIPPRSDSQRAVEVACRIPRINSLASSIAPETLAGSFSYTLWPCRHLRLSAQCLHDLT